MSEPRTQGSGVSGPAAADSAPLRARLGLRCGRGSVLIKNCCWSPPFNRDARSHGRDPAAHRKGGHPVKLAALLLAAAAVLIGAGAATAAQARFHYVPVDAQGNTRLQPSARFG